MCYCGSAALPWCLMGARRRGSNTKWCDHGATASSSLRPHARTPNVILPPACPTDKLFPAVSGWLEAREASRHAGGCTELDQFTQACPHTRHGVLGAAATLRGSMLSAEASDGSGELARLREALARPEAADATAQRREASPQWQALLDFLRRLDLELRTLAEAVPVALAAKRQAAFS